MVPKLCVASRAATRGDQNQGTADGSLDRGVSARSYRPHGSADEDVDATAIASAPLGDQRRAATGLDQGGEGAAVREEAKNASVSCSIPVDFAHKSPTW
jgi:hypothetical protein